MLIHYTLRLRLFHFLPVYSCIPRVVSMAHSPARGGSERCQPEEEEDPDPALVGLAIVSLSVLVGIGMGVVGSLARGAGSTPGGLGRGQASLLTLAGMASCAAAFSPVAGKVFWKYPPHRGLPPTPHGSQSRTLEMRGGGGGGGGGPATDNYNAALWDRQSPTSLEMPLFYPKDGEEREGPSRVVHCQEAVGWMEGLDCIQGSVFTSLPDIIEVDMTGDEEGYRKWFERAAWLAMDKLQEGQYALFYQTDVKLSPKTGKKNAVVTEWLDKSFLVSKAAERTGCHLLWRKFVAKSRIDRHNVGAPAFTHLLCFGKGPKAGYDATLFNCPDVIPRGLMLWPKAIGVDATVLGVRFLRDVVGAERVVDPFCGQGTILAVANALGLEAEGVDLSAQKCKRARRLALEHYLLDGYYDDSAYRGQMGRLLGDGGQQQQSKRDRRRQGAADQS